MLLLILFAGCLATSVAQNITVIGMPAQTTAFPIAFEGAMSAVYTPEYVAILQAYVQYAGPFDLNEMTAQLILKELGQRIRQELPDSSISLKIRNITKV